MPSDLDVFSQISMLDAGLPCSGQLRILRPHLLHAFLDYGRCYAPGPSEFCPLNFLSIRMHDSCIAATVSRKAPIES